MSEAEKRFGDFLEAAPDAMVIAGSDGRIVRVNGMAEKLFQWPREDLIGHKIEVLVPEEVREIHAGFRDRYFAQPHVRPMGGHDELSGRRRDGTVFPAEISLGPVRNGDETLVVCSIRDITRRLESREKIERNLHIQSTVADILKISLEPISLQEFLERTLDALLSIPWIRLKSKGGIFLADKSDAGTLLLRTHRGFPEALLKNCSRLPVGRCLCGRAAKQRKIVFSPDLDEDHEIRYHDIAPHGHYCVPILTDDALIGVINLYVETGHVRKPEEDTFLLSIANVLAGTIRRKEAEEALEKSEERFSLAVRGTDAGIWDWTLDTNKVYFSPRWKSMLGYTDHEIGSDFSEWERLLHPEDRENALATVKSYLKGSMPEYELEHRLRHKDGSYRWILARGAAVRDQDNRMTRMVGSHIDITERKRMEALLRHKEAQLMAAQGIQTQILPKEAPVVAGFDIAGATYAADLTAGDLYDFIVLPDGSIGFVIGDVTGHGLGPALVMASTHAYLHAFAETGIEVEEILARTNAALLGGTKENMFVTTFFGRLDPRERTLVYASAGHPPGFVLDAKGSIKASLERTSLPLGIDADAAFPRGETVGLEKGDTVLLLTDGLLEARSPDGAFFGVEHALEVVIENRHLGAREILDKLYQAIFEFTRREGLEDDVTLVVFKAD